MMFTMAGFLSDGETVVKMILSYTSTFWEIFFFQLLVRGLLYCHDCVFILKLETADGYLSLV